MLKILLADDSNVAQRMGKEILSAEGFEVLTVSNGQAALKKLSEFLPDLIIADVFMPGTGGYDLCQFVKSDKHQRHVPVILLVGAMEPYDPDEGRRVKADGMVTKPLQSSSLVKIVKDLLAAVTPAAPKKEKASKAAAAEADVPEAEIAKAPSGFVAEEPAQEWVTQKIEIPKEMAEQPMSGFEELLGPASEPEVRAEPGVVAGSAAPEAAAVLPIEAPVEAIAEATAQDAPAAFPVELPAASEPAIAFELSAPAAEPEAAPERIEFPVAPADAGDEPASSSIFPTFPGEAQEPEAESAPQMAMPVENVPVETLAGPVSTLAEAPAPVEAPAPPELRWIAESAEVTEEEKKLFDEPKAHWEELATMAEAEEAPSEAAAPSAQSAAEEKLAEGVSYVSDAEALPETSGAAPQHSADSAEIERLVREAVEQMMPQIVDRIARTVEIQLRREDE